MPRTRSNQPAEPGVQPQGDERPYSYSEDVNEAPAIVAAEPVDVEAAAPALPNSPVERLVPEDHDAALRVEGGELSSEAPDTPASGPRRFDR